MEQIARSMTRGSVVAVIAGAVFFIMFGGSGEPMPQEASSPGITIKPKVSLFTSESGGMDDSTGAHISEHTADATTGIYRNNTTEGIVDTSRLPFVQGNWDVPQTVTVIGANDAPDGTFRSWSRSYYGQLVDGTNVQKNRKTPIDTDANWAFVAVEGPHTVSL